MTVASSVTLAQLQQDPLGALNVFIREKIDQVSLLSNYRESVSSLISHITQHTTALAAQQAPVVEGGRLVRVQVHILHDLVEDQFYLPLVADAAGQLVNVGLYHTQPPMVEEEALPDLRCLSVRRLAMARVLYDLRNEESPALLLLHDSAHWEPCRLNTVHTVLALREEPEQEDDDAGYWSWPRLHVLGLLPDSEGCERQEEFSLGDAPLEGQSVVPALCQATGWGEAEAGLLGMALLSQVSSRINGLYSSLLIGTLTLNIICQNTEQGDDIISLLRQVAPQGVTLLGCADLNANDWIPRMDHERGVLIPGRLQQPPGRLLLFDERSLQEGPLSPQGKPREIYSLATANLAALIHLIQHQALSFDFGNSGGNGGVQIAVDHPIIALSLRSRTVLPIPTHLKAPNLQIGGGVDLVQVRERLRALMRGKEGEWSISEEMAAQVENDYVQVLRGGKQEVDEQGLSRLLNLARLWSRLQGERALSSRSWQSAMAHRHNWLN